MVATKDETKSRDIIWIPLLPAKYSDAIKLFEGIIYLEKQKPLSLKMQRSLAGLEQCIADCNGHFRSLESLWRLWAWIKSEEPSYSVLIRQLGHAVEDKYGSLKLPHVRAALLGKPVCYNEKVPGLPLTFGEYLEMGLFLNSIAEGATDNLEEFVPRVSPFQLLLFAAKNIHNRTWKVCVIL